MSSPDEGDAEDSIDSREEAETEFRKQLSDAFEESEFPVEDPFEIIPMLPDGKQTTFVVGDVSIPAKDIGLKYGEYLDFPYETVSGLIDDILYAVKDNDDLFEEEREWEYSTTIDLGGGS